MKLVFAQGNPGVQYEHTRHNSGFLAIDFFARQNGAQFQPKPKFHANIAELTIDSEKVLLVKPTTFYNETGQSARAIVDFYKLDTSDILVLHDELALPFGTLRIREKGSDAGNNGIKSLNAHLGENYYRLRIGIANEHTDTQDAAAFVLTKFTHAEMQILHKDIFPKVAETIDDFSKDTHQLTSYVVT